jgi:CRISPR-associated protein (TIGR03986 family)
MAEIHGSIVGGNVTRFYTGGIAWVPIVGTVTPAVASAAAQGLVEVIGDEQPDGITNVRMPYELATVAGHDDITDTTARPVNRQRQDRKTDFFNPYNWIPVAPRTLTGPLADADLSDQHSNLARWHTERFTGELQLTVEAFTPLLFPGAQFTEDIIQGKKHITLSTRQEDGRPVLPATSFKGTLMSMLEGITNSRFSVFDNDDKLGYRAPVDAAPNLVPAQVVDTPDGLMLELLTGASNANGDRITGEATFAAWVKPEYPENPTDLEVATQLARHGTTYTSNFVLCQHRNKYGNPDFQVWVEEGATGLGSLTELTAPRVISGQLFTTGKTVKNKHYERLFFSDVLQADRVRLPLTEALISSHRRLGDEQFAINEKLLKARTSQHKHPYSYLGNTPGQTSFAPHIWDAQRKNLVVGSLVWAEVSRTAVKAVHPVQIGRRLYPATPKELMHDSLLPAVTVGQLSPADRMRGWVSQAKSDSSKGEVSSVKGRLWVKDTICTTTDSIETFTPSLVMSILSTPKPNNGGFYVGEAQGESGWAWSQPDGRDREQRGFRKPTAGNAARSQLRRKTYPHHGDGEAADPEYWFQQVGANWYRHRRLGNTRDDQNRSVKTWVKPYTTFAVTVGFDDLTTVELGALVWLCSLGEDHFWRLGGAKPLGLGSASVLVAKATYRTGEQIRRGFLTWPPTATSEEGEFLTLSALIDEFKRAMQSAYGGVFELIPCIAATLRSAKGWPEESDQSFRPTHYPYAYRPNRAAQQPEAWQPSTEGVNYEWWVDNEKGKRMALPDLEEGLGFPIFGARP